MLIRTMLSIPSNSPKMLLNCNVMGADIILFDLEDGVAPQQKIFARELLRSYLSSGLVACQSMVRVNDVTTPYFLDDIKTVIPLPISGIMLPKMEQPEDILYADEQIRNIEAEHGLPLGSRVIIGTAETALGVENALMCLQSCPRLIGCSFGSEDFTASIGVARTASNEELDYARKHLVIAAKAAGKLAIDTVYTDVTNDDGLRAVTAQGKALGYDGKFVISPRQIPIVHSVYTPNQSEIAYAKRIVEKMEEASHFSRGVAVLDGKMLDKPVLQRAERLLEMARAAGICC